ncbi:MAG: protein kinase domain-containing protein, partial [Planctomycetota bacterium]
MAGEEILFDRYRGIKVLGRGGMGTVYLVEDMEEGDARRALKIVDLPPGRGNAFDLLRSEFEILARYEHPHLARAFEIGREGQRAYFTLEYVSETDLLEVSTRLDTEQILAVGVQVLQALAFIHGLGFAHGDVKPQNILVDISGPAPVARLLDFGLAESLLESEERSGTSSGTPAYFPPEKAQGAPPDPRSDLYSFGVTLFQLLTGQLPFRGANAGELIEQHRFHPPPPPSSLDTTLPEPLDRFCLRLMEKEPRLRFPSAEAALAALAPLAPRFQGIRDPEAGKHLIQAAFVGREDSIAAVESRIDPILSGAASPQGIVVQGSVGIGKSRLVREIALNARVKGCRVVGAACSASPRNPLDPLIELVKPLAKGIDRLEPFLRDALRDVLEGRIPLGGGAGTSMQSFRFQQGVQSLWASASKEAPVVFVLEDIHWAEPALLQALGRLLESAEEGAWVLLMTGREHFEMAPSRRIVQGWVEGDRVSVVPLSPFGDEEIDRWITTALPGIDVPAETVERIARGGGTPLFIREVLLSGLDESRFVPSAGGWRYVPPPEGEVYPSAGIQTQRRFRSLSAEEKEILHALALARGAVSLEVLVRFLDRKSTAPVFSVLRKLGREGWTQEHGKGRTFSLFHGHLRRPILLDMEGRKRREGYRRFAEILTPEVEKGEEVLTAVAEFWARAGEREETETWCTRVGRM